MSSSSKVVPLDEANMFDAEEVIGAPRLEQEGVHRADDNSNEETKKEVDVSSSSKSATAVAGATVSVGADEWQQGTENEYERHMASCNAIDRSFLYRGLKSMRMYMFVPMILSPWIYAHGFTWTYIFLEDHFFLTLQYHFWISCAGFKHMQETFLPRLGYGEAMDKVPFKIDVIYFLVTQSMCLFLYWLVVEVLMGVNDKPFMVRYQNANTSNMCAWVFLPLWYIWLVKGPYKVSSVHTRRLVVTLFSQSTLGNWLPVMYMMFTGMMYLDLRDAFNSTLGTTAFQFLFDILLIGICTALVLPFFHRLCSKTQVGSTGYLRSRCMKGEGVWGHDKRDMHANITIFMMIERFSQAMHYSRYCMMFASPLSSIWNLSKDAVFMVAHFHWKYSVEHVGFAIQRSGNRGAGELWVKSNGRNKTLFQEDELISDEVEAYRYHQDLFIETNDITDEDKEIYKKPLPAAANLKKFMQYCVDIVPKMLRLLFIDEVEHPFPWYELAADRMVKEEGRVDILEDPVYQKVAYQDLMYGLSNKVALSVKHDHNRVMYPQCLAQFRCISVPALSMTDSMGSSHYRLIRERFDRLVTQELHGVDAQGNKLQVELPANALEDAARPSEVEHGGDEKKERSAALGGRNWRDASVPGVNEETRTIGNPDTVTGHMTNWLSNTGRWSPKHDLTMNLRLKYHNQLAPLDQECYKGDTQLYQLAMDKLDRFHWGSKDGYMEADCKAFLYGFSVRHEDFEDSSASVLGTLSRYHMAVLNPLILKVQAKNTLMCHTRWASKFAACLELIVLVFFTRDAMIWGCANLTEAGHCEGNQMVMEMITSLKGSPTIYFALFAMFCVDVCEICFTEWQRWNHVVGGRKRALPVLDKMLIIETGGPWLPGRAWWLWVVMISLFSIGIIVMAMLGMIRGDLTLHDADYGTDNSRYSTSTTTKKQSGAQNTNGSSAGNSATGGSSGSGGTRMLFDMAAAAIAHHH